MKNLFKHILFGAAIFAGMGLFVGCDTMTDDEIEKLINDKLNESSSNATADATPPVELAGTSWVSYSELPDYKYEYDEDLGEYIQYEVYEEYFLHFTKTTAIFIDKTYKKEDDSLVDERETTGGYYVQGNIIFLDETGSTVFYDKQKNCLYFVGLKFNLVEE